MDSRNLLERWIDWDTKDDHTAPYVWRVRWFLYGLFAMMAIHLLR